MKKVRYDKVTLTTGERIECVEIRSGISKGLYYKIIHENNGKIRLMEILYPNPEIKLVKTLRVEDGKMYSKFRGGKYSQDLLNLMLRQTRKKRV